MKKFVKRFIGEFLLILGVGLFVYNVLNFESEGYPTTEGGPVRLIPRSSTYRVYNYQCFDYYYLYDTKKQIVAGAVLMTIGILIIRNKQKVEIKDFKNTLQG